MKVFSTDLRLYATAYIVAESQEKADEIAKGLAESFVSMPEGYCGPDGLEVWGGTFNENMPEISLSPAMTIAPLDQQDIACDYHSDVETEDDEDEMIDCGQCEGSGEIEGGLSGDSGDEECPVCDGSGTIRAE